MKYLLVVSTKTRVMMSMKRSRNAANPAIMPISSISFVGFVTSPGPWQRAGVRAQFQPVEPPQPAPKALLPSPHASCLILLTMTARPSLTSSAKPTGSDCMSLPRKVEV